MEIKVEKTSKIRYLVLNILFIIGTIVVINKLVFLISSMMKRDSSK